MRESIRLKREAHYEARLSEILAKRVETEQGCLIHTGKKGTYGTLYYKGKQENLHRLAYLREYGEIPKGMYILHTCNNKECSNPKHLYAGTQSENIKDWHSGDTRTRKEKEEQELELEEQEIFALFSN